MLDGKDYSRRDELESLAYTFMFLINPKQVPWASDTNLESIAKKKREFLTD